MIDINELRRLAQAATPGPWHATKSVETNSWAVWSDTTRLMELRPTKTVDMYRVSNTAAFIAAANPAAITELLDRLEAAESEALEEARLNGMGSEREAALLSKLEAAEKERDSARKLADSLALALNTSNHERDALRAKVEAMENQEPVAWMLNCQTLSGDTGWILSWTQSGAGLCNRLKGEENEKRLYALPVAQPAPRGVDDVIEAAVTRFLSWKLPGDFHPDGGVTFTPGHIAPSSPHWPTGTNLLNAQQARDMLCHVLAAAPEAKP